MKASRCACSSVNITQIYVGTICFILEQGYMFRPEVSHLQVLNNIFRYQMLCPLWDPIVFTVVECILVKNSPPPKVLILFIKCFIYRFCLNIKTLKILP